MSFPESTYRLQFHAGFTFRDAAAIVPYLHALGVTHVYASPYLKARPGSTHGYDVIDHCSLNPELGTEADYEAFLAALRDNNLSHILDTVPNHVGVATNDNAWWNDVLKHGPASQYAKYFDITWQGSARPELHDKVLLPVLGAPYGQVLERGELQLVFDNGGLAVAYYDRRFPISPETAESVFSRAKNSDDALRLFNGRPGDPHSSDLLDDLLNHQHYRLSYWHTASDEINYRRFFDINDLAALAQEHEEVFEATHALTLRLVAEGKVVGLRIDHPDGLYDPRRYLQRLQEHHGSDSPLYVVVEKILASGENLPPDWPTHGTSGYDFLVMVNGLYVDAHNADAFTNLYQDWIHDHTPFHDIVYEKKRLILRISLASELHMLARRLDRLAQRDRHSRDFTLNGLLEALRETIACFRVYRTYVADEGPVSKTDQQHVETAINRAIARNPKTSPEIFNFLRDTLLLRFGPEPLRRDQRRFAGKFQQLTAPATAKGVEDTAFYVYNRLTSLNEVGGEPSHFGTTPDALHQYLKHRQQHWPYALSPLSTHDTKRSEDVRARINVLSEIPDEWRQHVTRWREINARFRKNGIPGPNEEYLLYQTLIGAWPIAPTPPEYDQFVERIQAYMLKAAREAKVFTSWTDPNANYENTVRDFIYPILYREKSEFLNDFHPFQERISHLGLLNSLSQTLLRLTAPGVPDTYQGAELWDFSLVDPDNRRPVDYPRRDHLLRDLTAQSESTADLPAFAKSLLDCKEDGRIKLFLTRRALLARRDHPGLFTTGDYIPLRADGPGQRHLFAFARRHEARWAVVALPRLPATLPADAWRHTRLSLPAPMRLQDAFTNQVFPEADSSPTAATLFSHLPFALLLSAE